MLIDAFMFHNEFDLVASRIEYLKDQVDYFCIIESAYTFTGQDKEFTLKKFIIAKYGKKFFDERICLYLNDQYINANNYEQVVSVDTGSLVVKEIKRAFVTLDAHRYIWLNDLYQRECIKICVDECIKSKHINEDHLFIIISDVDEIPSKNFVKLELLQKDYAVFAEMDQYRYNLQIKDKAHWIGSVKCHYQLLNELSVNEIRFAYKRSRTDLRRKCILSEGGWHFTSLGNEADIKKKMNSWGHQELNTFINRLFLKFRLKYGFDIFGRAIKFSIIDTPTVPNVILSHLQNHLDVSVKTSYLHHKMFDRFIWAVDRLCYKAYRVLIRE